jgi:tetratricopeptide (TPR) repeat protein
MKKTVIRNIGIIVTILLILPIGIYIINFYSNGISKNPENWGVFGDFFGGVLNPIISLIGTILLGYLTYMVSKISSEENKNLFKYEQKVIAYQKIANITSEIDYAMDKVKIHNDFMISYGKLGKEEKAIEHYTIAMESLLITLSKLSITLNNFSINYSHLFKYDFESKEFKKLTSNSKDYFQSFDINNLDSIKNFNIKSDYLINDFKGFLKKLKKEIG